MKKFLIRIGACAVFFLSALGAQAATLSELTIADRVDETTMKPLNPKTRFDSAPPYVWGTAFVEKAKDGDEIATEWFYQETPDSRPEGLTRTATPVVGTRYAAFRLRASEGQKLPDGRYELRYYLNGDLCGSLYFYVGAKTKAFAVPAPKAAEPKPAAPAPKEKAKPEAKAPAEGYMKYTDKKGRFTVELPGKWFPAEVEEPIAVYISENMNSKPVATIAISAVPANLSKVFNRMDAILGMREKLVNESKEHGAALKLDSLSEAQNPDQNAWLLGFSYKGPNGKDVEDRKIITCSGKWIFVFNVMIEPEAKELMAPVFEHVIDSFTALE